MEAVNYYSRVATPLCHFENRQPKFSVDSMTPRACVSVMNASPILCELKKVRIMPLKGVLCSGLAIANVCCLF